MTIPNPLAGFTEVAKTSTRPLPTQTTEHSAAQQQQGKPEKPRRVKYQTKTIHLSVWSKRKLERHLRRGWEVVNSYGGALGTTQTVTLRREKR